MNSNNPMPPGSTCSTKSGRLAIATLIACLALLCSLKSTASIITQADSSRVGQILRLDPKPIRLTEAGARQVLKDKADLIHFQAVVDSQSILLNEQKQALTAQNQTITQLNDRQQAKANDSFHASNLAEKYRRQRRAARWENWGWRIGLTTFLLIKFRLITF